MLLPDLHVGDLLGILHLVRVDGEEVLPPGVLPVHERPTLERRDADGPQVLPLRLLLLGFLLLPPLLLREAAAQPGAQDDTALFG